MKRIKTQVVVAFHDKDVSYPIEYDLVETVEDLVHLLENEEKRAEIIQALNYGVASKARSTARAKVLSNEAAKRRKK